jgi:hypothetical protein
LRGGRFVKASKNIKIIIKGEAACHPHNTQKMGSRPSLTDGKVKEVTSAVQYELILYCLGDVLYIYKDDMLHVIQRLYLYSLCQCNENGSEKTIYINKNRCTNMHI